MATDFNYANTITAGTPVAAAEVQDNFDDVLAWIKAYYQQTLDTTAEIAAAVATAGVTQAGKTNAATDGSGEIAVTFPTAFSSAPIVVATAADLIGSVGFNVMVDDETTTGFTIVVYYNNAKWTDPQVVPINWIAFEAA